MTFRTPKNAVVIGLSGGICAGKTTATQVLEAELGAKVFNADHFGHEAYKPGSQCQKQLVEHFGDRVLNKEDGTIDRRVLGSIVFANPEEMQALNRIVWPAIRELLQQNIDAHAAQLPSDGKMHVIVLEAAVMIEAKWVDMVDELWILATPREIAMDRLMKRNGLSEGDAKARIDAQLSNDERKSVSNVYILNDVDEESFKTKLKVSADAVKSRYSKQSAFEFVDVVDSEDNVLYHAKRAVVREFNLIHRSSYIVMLQKKSGQVFVQKRSQLKDAGPGLLDPAPGGVVGAGESYEENATRELEEEMGISGEPIEMVGKFYHEHEVDGRSWGSIFTLSVEKQISDLKLQTEEVESIRLMTLGEILTSPQENFLPCGLAAFKKYVSLSGSEGSYKL